MPANSEILQEVALLARQFADVLHVWLTPAEFAEMQRRNRTPKYDKHCASHDFCDANIAMEDAFKRTFGREPNLESDTDIDLWNKAWDVAKKDLLS
jgi:hypothetical protein